MRDSRVVEAMERVPREEFVPGESRHLAYEDHPLPIGEDQTISQPFIVALMLEALELRRSDRVLEVGTGSGYQAALLGELAREVVTVERIDSLAAIARERLGSLGYGNVAVETWPVTGWAGPTERLTTRSWSPPPPRCCPRSLREQLGVGGRMIVPVGPHSGQELMKVTRTGDSFSVRTMGGCRFVPLIGPYD